MNGMKGERMHILLDGKDARTDAIAAACRASASEPTLTVITEQPIPGLVDKCDNIVIGSLTDMHLLRRVAEETRPDLAIIGPEEPLWAGAADVLTDLGIPTFGPTKRLAAIEHSKSWARMLLDRYEIPGNPEYRIFDEADRVREYMKKLGSFVIKPDGLTAGKGVRVFGEHLQTVSEALAYAESIIASHGRVQIEEHLDGEEFTLQTITDGETVIHCPIVQDFKRAFDGDQGPNTGGMGSYSCPDFSLPFLEQRDVDEALAINERVIAALANDLGEPYRGVLYGGFMATASGVRVIEFNSRFGDPEVMNILLLLQADFVELSMAAATGTLHRVPYSFIQRATVCKYLAPTAYPEETEELGTIDVPLEYQDRDDLKWFWAACRRDGADIYLTSSRAGAFVSIADTLAEAERIAEEAANAVRGPVRHRKDIGRAEVLEKRIRHMCALRGVSATAITSALTV